MTKISFILNDKPRVTDVDPKMSLLKYLRGKDYLKGTKNGCGTGHCGACTILLNGKPVRSCITPMERVQDGTVLTIEGLANGDQLHPIQKAFLDVGAIQCGFCTPGMILATKALLDQNPHPTIDDICQALKHNYCRCTGYVKIIEAVLLAAARMRNEEPSVEEVRCFESSVIVKGQNVPELPPISGKVLGQSIWDTDGVKKATGSLRFCDDIEFPDMVYGAFVWSGITRGKIIHFDDSEALAMPGVLRVIKAEDVPGDNHYGTFNQEQEIFCIEEVHFISDMLALVVAETMEQARAAAQKVKVEYEPLPGLYTIKEALDAEAVIGTSSRQVGDLEQAKKKSTVVVNGEYKIERVEHGCMEPESAIGYALADGAVIYTTTQSPFEIRRMLASILNLPEEKIRVIATPLGGGFGSKCDAHIESAAAVAGYVMKRPVKITLTRQESMYLSTKRHAFETDFTIGVDAEGKLQFLDAKLYSDAGPYNNLSVAVLQQASIFAGGPYVIPNVNVQGKALRTNNVLGGAFRGFGINQSAISIETLLDEAAEKLGMDPFEIRKINALKIGTRTVGGELLKQSVGISDTIELCKRHTQKAMEAYKGLYPQGSKVLGVGVASGFKNVGVGRGNRDDGGCILTRETDGRVTMHASGVDMGQGFRTAMMQILAEALDISTDQINLVSSDTAKTLFHGQAVSERQTLNTGRAVVEAAKLLKKRIEEHGDTPIDAPITVEYAFSAPQTYGLEDAEGRKEAGDDYRNYPSYAYTTQAAIIELDTDTGEVKVLKVIAAHDTGRVINPHIVEGQIEGSCSMGIGYALREQFPSVDGIPNKKYYGQLELPTIDETPQYDIILVEDPEPIGPFGAKGISEVATVPMTPAVLNAIYNAAGIRIRNLPATPENILEHIKLKKQTSEHHND